jgi:hypothetical protein
MSSNINITNRLSIQDDGSVIAANAKSINFAGAGVVASAIGDDVIVTITGGGGGGGGTVTSVSALTIGTTGTDISSTVVNSTTTPVITINIPTASALNRGALSASDWTIFNNKVGGSGTINRHSKWITTNTLGDSLIQDDGTTLSINTTPSATIQFLIASNKSRGLSANGLSVGVFGGVNANLSAAGNYYGVYGTSEDVTGDTVDTFTYGTYGKAECGVGAYGYSSGALAPNIGVAGEAVSTGFETPGPLAIGGKFSATGGTLNYAIQLIDGTQGTGKFLKSVTSDGKGNWANITVADTGLSLTTTGSNGSSTLVSNTLNIPTYTAAGLGAVETSRQLTINGTSYDLSADRSWSVGTVTSISNFTITFNGTSVTTGVSDPFVAPSLNINIPIANSFVSRGLLSGSDWSIFNGKQNAITFTTTGISGSASFSSNILNIPQYVGRSAGTGTVDRVPVWATASTLKDGTLYDNGSTVAVGGSPISSAKLYIYDDSSVTYGIAVNAAKTGGGGLGVDSASYGAGAATNTGLRGSASNSNTLNLGVSGIATAATPGTNIGLYGSASAGSSNYAIQLQDGTENVVGRFLKNMTTDGKANWATLTVADTGLTLTTSGTSGAATLVGNTLNIPQYSSGGGSQNLASVLTVGNTASTDINMSGFDVTNIDEVSTSATTIKLQSVLNSTLIFYANNC